LGLKAASKGLSIDVPNKTGRHLQGRPERNRTLAALFTDNMSVSINEAL